MIGYVGTYRVLAPLNLDTGKVTSNENDTYLLGKYQIECYRINDNTLAIYLPTGNNAANIILPPLKELGVILTLRIDGDCESVYTFDEQFIHQVHSVVKFQTKGKNIKPFSVATARKQAKKLS